MLNEELQEINKRLSILPRRTTRIIHEWYENIVKMQEGGYLLQNILDVLKERNIMPPKTTLKTFKNTLYWEKRRRKERQKTNHDTQKSITSPVKTTQNEVPAEDGKSVPLEVPASVPTERNSPLIQNLTEEERTQRRIEQREKEKDEIAKRRAEIKAKEAQENPQAVTIDPLTKKFTINDLA